MRTLDMDLLGPRRPRRGRGALFLLLVLLAVNAWNVKVAYARYLGAAAERAAG